MQSKIRIDTEFVNPPATHPTRAQQMKAVSQLLIGHPAGLRQSELLALLGRGAKREELLATLNTMVSRSIAVRVSGRGASRFAMAAERAAYTAAANDNELLSAVHKTDDARRRAAGNGMASTIPPPRRATGNPETVDEWMARTGNKPERIANNFDKPLDRFPGRRPSLPRYIM
ncbi:hypothetical protein ABE493_07700 [Stenotrophomonas terrae]|uniref:hypothetical protein n=1 Tax=Stenotrophomonas terrae TaxID=405446 RepID=UPI00320859F5